MRWFLLSTALWLVMPAFAAPRKPLGGTLGTRVYVVERDAGTLAVYDYAERRLLTPPIEGLGDLRHATMTFSPDLRWGFLATRAGVLYRVNLETGRADGEVKTSDNSIDNAVSHDGRTIAVAEYIPGGVTLVDAATLKVRARHEAIFQRGGERLTSRVTGMVDAPGNRFVCVLMEGQEIWLLDASRPDVPVTHRIPAGEGLPYDAMITPDGRHYVVGKLGSERVAVLDLARPEAGVREVSIADPSRPVNKEAPRKLPHMASWAVAGEHVFVPLVGEPRLAVLDRRTFEFRRSVPLRGHPVYTVRAPNERELWVTFSGEKDDAWIQIVDTETLAVTGEIEVGRRIYHLDFTPRGSHALVSANADEKLLLVDTLTRRIVDSESLPSPSGIFGPWRAFRLGL